MARYRATKQDRINSELSQIKYLSDVIRRWQDAWMEAFADNDDEAMVALQCSIADYQRCIDVCKDRLMDLRGA